MYQGDATTAAAIITTTSERHGARATTNAITTAANVQSENARTSWPSPRTTPQARTSGQR